MNAARARSLARAHPEAAQPLIFYANLLDLQQTLPQILDFALLAAAVPPFLSALLAIAPPPLASAARDLLDEGADRWQQLLRGYWDGERDVDSLRAFFAEAMLQPLARRQLDCQGPPVVAVLRDKAHGSERSFVCGFCLNEYPAPRLGCPACGEQRFEQLAVYRSDAFAAARIDACESCRTYLKTIDLTQDATAIPVVDDLATLTLDVWAREQGYTRSRPNLLRL
jgi:FdhE protein